MFCIYAVMGLLGFYKVVSLQRNCGEVINLYETQIQRIASLRSQWRFCEGPYVLFLRFAT
ncbi:hypothetical protein SAMN04488514_10879 [Kriegella aquimaris]|uniref:Uncharacterized protein n=1 Tax=Kriegella aquimaris TaxID=192904 RepID=A0A1G9SS63_9FLAO|nr:hypothetical protein SAMN04488514_10879 [Kriegella aquimaris]